MSENIKDNLSKSMEEFRLPSYMEIPNVGLYLEQTSNYIMEYLQILPGMSLTGSMISNYVKKKIIPNTKKKLYDREQIAYLFFIAIAKSVLSLEDVQLLIELQKETCSCEEAYAYFCRELKTTLNVIFESNGAEQEEFSENSGTDTQERDLLRKMVAAVAHKVYIDKYLEMIRTEKQN